MIDDRVLFVALEGLDNAGKTTLVSELSKEFSNLLQVIQAKELTSTIGPVIRKGLDAKSYSPIEKVLLFAADRQLRYAHDLAKRGSGPVLYIADRWIFSAFSYRYAENPRIEEYVKSVNAVFPIPDITIFIDITAQESINRGGLSDRNNYNYQHLERVRGKYLAIALEYNMMTINGMRNIDAVREEVSTKIREGLIARGFVTDG